jgi:serine/threonine-protein kinase
MVGRIFLGRYQATRLLGEGGMGRVYLARQLDLGRQVVVKVMHEQVAADPNFQERFQRETLLMARFQHPYAVTLYDASLNDPEGPCIIMEYIRGVTLDTLLESNGRLSAPRVGRLLGQVCEVLQAAHSQGIIHRDLKPANLMVVDADSPYEKVKVMDFGLATLAERKRPAPELMKDKKADMAVGTPGYMCPELIRGEKCDHRGDLYSLGVILFELLTGKPPFEGNSPVDVMFAHATEEPPTFAEMGAVDWAPPAVEAVVRACLAKEPKQRPVNARDLAERYEIALDHEQVVQQKTLPPEHPRSENYVPPPPERRFDSRALVHELEAWMPEMMMAYKLRGFVQDAGGEVLECEPGHIRVHLGGRGSQYRSNGSGALSWLRLGRKSGQIELNLFMDRIDCQRESHLHITVAILPVEKSERDGLEWHERCEQIFCDLRGYVMGHTGNEAVRQTK